MWKYFEILIKKIEQYTWEAPITDWKKDFTKTSWTKEKEDEFIKDTMEFLKDKYVLEELSTYPKLMKSKVMRKKWIDSFLFAYWPRTISEN